MAITSGPPGPFARPPSALAPTARPLHAEHRFVPSKALTSLRLVQDQILPAKLPHVRLQLWRDRLARRQQLLYPLLALPYRAFLRLLRLFENVFAAFARLPAENRVVWIM